MNYEILFLISLFIFSLATLFTDGKRALYVLLAISVLLHKELFSIYSWNILPARVFMAALLVFVMVKVLWSVKRKDYLWLKDSLSNPVSVSLLVFWAIAGISLFFSKNLSASLSIYAFLTTMVALYFYLRMSLNNSKENVLSVIKAYIVVAFVLSLIGYVQIYVFQEYQFIFGAFWNVPGHIPRIGSLFWDVNHFAGLLVLLLPVTLALVVTSRRKQGALFLLISLSILVTLLLTFARSGWIAGGLAFLVFALILIFRKLRYKGLAIIFALILVLSGGFLTQYLNKDSPIRFKIRQYFHYRLDSFDSHFLLLTGSWQVFEKYPFLGGGYGSFYEHFSKTKIAASFFSRDPAALNTRVPAHSIWGELLAETGVLGFTAMLVFYSGVVFTLLYASLRLKNRQDFIINAAMAGSVIGILTAGIFYSYNSEFFWIILFLYFLYALFCLQNDEREGKRLWINIYSFFISNPKFPMVVLFVLSTCLIFFNLGTNSLIPYDEAIYAKVSKNIVQDHDWLTMSWREGSPWFEKPPLYFWLSAGILQIIPDSPELAVRIPSAFFGLLTVMLVYLFGRKLFGKTAGFVAGLSLLTTFHFLYYSRIGMLDVTCGFFITASLYFYYQSRKISYLLLSGVFMGLAILTKGVVGVLPLVIVTAYEILAFGFRLFKKRLTGFSVIQVAGRLIVVLLMSALVFLPWHLKMYQLHGQKFLDSYLGYHVLERVTMEVEDKTGPLYWYAIVLKVSMRIWFIALIPSLLFAAYSLIRNPDDRKKLAFVFFWAAVILIIFSVSRTKLVWYIIPVYPVLSILIGYFYSYVLSLVDRKMSRLSHLSSFVLKSSVIFITAGVSLMYLFFNIELAYISDLTGSQVQMMELKNTTYGSGVGVYLDRVDLPLAMFYTDGPFEITDFTPLREKISSANKEGRRLVFVTKESRFKKLKEEFPAVKFVASSNEWYLGELVGK